MKCRLMHLLVKVLIFCIDALKRILPVLSHDAVGKSRRVEKCGGEAKRTSSSAHHSPHHHQRPSPTLPVSVAQSSCLIARSLIHEVSMKQRNSPSLFILDYLRRCSDFQPGKSCSEHEHHYRNPLSTPVSARRHQCSISLSSNTSSQTLAGTAGTPCTTNLSAGSLYLISTCAGDWDIRAALRSRRDCSKRYCSKIWCSYKLAWDHLVCLHKPVCRQRSQ